MNANRAPVILNVDDHEPALYARTRILERAGYTVLRASSGTEALEVVQSARPDLVLLDVHLPDISGIEVCRLLKQNPEIPSVSVLQITASALSAESHVRALQMGADTYLVEPVDPGVLLATIQSLLRMRAAEDLLRRANSDLQRSNQELQEFAYVASHDLKEPLRTVTSYSQLLAKRFGEHLGSEGREYIDFISGATLRMRDLIDDLLLYSQIGKERERVAVDAEAALGRVISDLHHAIDSSGAVISRGPLPAIQAWPDGMEHILQNLIGNAIKYQRPHTAPLIHVSAEREKNAWRFCVQDNGIGFEPQYADQIFGIFKRLDARASGTGIGLAIVRKIVEGHGGRIWATSEPGVGSKFCFTIADVAEASAG